jgi:glyoxylase-like metal-dependent hydrolase (beta-lactamase superfamily II)
MSSTVDISLFAAGYCSNLERIVLKDGRLRSVRFPATCALIEHPEHGFILFDTGYSSYVFEGAKQYPLCIYPWITPIHFQEPQSVVNQLRARGILPEQIKFIILSHFHIDHMGGLRDFPQATFVFSKTALESTCKLTGLKALLSAYMPSLVPHDMLNRARVLDNTLPPFCPLPYPEFDRGYDLFGDGSLMAVELPGHATGQIGIFLKTKTKTIFLAADACWSSRAYKEFILPHFLARFVITDHKAYKNTLWKLHRLHQQNPEVIIIPTHCEEALCSLS